MEFGDLLQSYIDEHFRPAAEWVQQQYLHALPMLNYDAILCALLLQLGKNGVQSREEFCIKASQALYGFLPTTQHNELVNNICDKANIYLSKPNMGEYSYWNATRGNIDYYADDELNAQSGTDLILTANVQRHLKALNVVLQASANTCFMLVGPAGAAKTLMLQYAVQQQDGYDMITINCSTQLTPAYITHSLKQHCVTVSGLRGREYRPKQTRLVLFLRNLHLCQLDSWGDSEVMELLLQLVQRQGFYAANLEWINVHNLQICASISNGSTSNNATNILQDTQNLLKISNRFLALNQFIRIAAPSDADMRSVLQVRLENLFTRRFQASAPNVAYIVEGLMEFFNKLQVEFSPAEGYAHYQFSPKLLIKVLEDLRYYPDHEFNEALYCELNCTFKDRLGNTEHIETYESLLKQTLRKILGKEKIYFVPQTPKHNSTLLTLQHDDWMDELQKQLTICSTENLLIDQPVTRELLELSAKLTRVLARHEKHILLVGEPGSRLVDALYAAMTMQQSKFVLPQGATNYAITDFLNDLKLAMQSAALENQCTCFVIEHCWITYAPEILKPIEALLEGSEIIDLFGEDLESIASALKHAAQLEGYQESVGSYFLKRVKENLHFVIILNSTSPDLNKLFNKYPALYRNTELSYVRATSHETLTLLPKAYVTMLGDTVAASEKENVPVSSYFGDMLDDLVPQKPPKRYYQLISCYFYVYKQLSTEIQKRLEKLQLGVEKLSAAHALVDTLKSEAGKQEEELAEKRRLANDALEMISSTMRNANAQKTNMLELKQRAQVSSEQLKQRQKEIAEELSEVEPILAEASAAVGQIKGEALSEIRSLRAPPETIRDILEGVLRLMGIKDTSWNSMKTFLAKRGVKEDIRSLQPAQISPEHCAAVEKLLEAKSDSFEMRNAKRASAAAAPLAAWVKACVRYARVIQSIKPLEREQRELKSNLNVAEEELESLKTGLDDVDKRVQQLSFKLNSYTQEAAVLELKLQEARTTLNSAETLVQKLSAEFQTWSQQLSEYKNSCKTLDTKSLLIAVSINYLAHMLLNERK